MSTNSKTYMNWTAVSYTPTGGSLTSITRVTTGMFGYGGSLKKFKGDANNFPIVIVAPDQEPHASFTSGDVATLSGFTIGVGGSLTGTLNEATGDSSVNIVFTLANAVFENVDPTGSHAEFATATATWQAYSSDGVTNPLSFTT